MAINWFYADSHNQQQGPVDKTWLVGAYASGIVRADTLVWREGLSGWVPLRQVGAQMGLMIVGAAPVIASTSSGSPVRGPVKPSSSSSWIVAVVVILVLVALVGILAAIAVPAYQDYVWRAKLMESLRNIPALKKDVADLREALNRCPVNGDEGIGSATSYATTMVDSVDVGPLESGGDCAITITFADVPRRDIAGRHLQFTLDRQREWSTNSEVPTRFLPLSMREATSN